MSTKTYTADEVREMLRQQTSGRRMGEWARTHGVSVQYVSIVASGKVGIGDSIARGLGLRKTIAWTVDNEKKKS